MGFDVYWLRGKVGYEPIAVVWAADIQLTPHVVSEPEALHVVGSHTRRTTSPPHM